MARTKKERQAAEWRSIGENGTRFYVADVQLGGTDRPQSGLWITNAYFACPLDRFPEIQAAIVQQTNGGPVGCYMRCEVGKVMRVEGVTVPQVGQVIPTADDQVDCERCKGAGNTPTIPLYNEHGAELWTADGSTFGLNPEYVAAVGRGPRVTMKRGHVLSPARIQDGDRLLGVVMPVRIGNPKR